MSVHAYGKLEPEPRVARLRNLFDGLVLVESKQHHAHIASTWVYKEGLTLKWVAKALLNGTIIGQTAGNIEIEDFEALRGMSNLSAAEWAKKVTCDCEKKREAGQSSNAWGTQVPSSPLSMVDQTLKAAVAAVCPGIVWDRVQAYLRGEGGGWAADGKQERFPAAPKGGAEVAAAAAAREAEDAERVHAVKVQFDKKYAETLRLMDALGVEGGDEAEAEPVKIDFLCHGLKDTDVARLAAGLQRTTRGPALIDLQHNAIEDGGVQTLVLALATGAAPALRELRLDGNHGITQVGRNLLTGLGLMRKELVIKLKEPELQQPAVEAGVSAATAGGAAAAAVPPAPPAAAAT